MNPDERRLLERALKLSEENNRILRKLETRARWSTAWGFIKFLIVIVPLIAGYIYLQPYLDQALGNFNNLKSLINQQ